VLDEKLRQLLVLLRGLLGPPEVSHIPMRLVTCP
jgi:hypothetical protein